MQTITSKDGTKIAYDVYGSGPALIYITGASCFRNFMPIVQDAKAFGKAFTVYNYDRRGRGDSGNTLPWSVEREVDDIEALINAAGGKAYIYGHSSGAVLALEAAMRLGEKVQKVVIYDASNVHDEKEKASYAVFGSEIQKLLDTGENAKAMKRFLAIIGMPKILIALLPVLPGWKTMKALAPTLAYDIALTADLPPLKRASKITIPLHIIVGEKSPARLRSVADQLVKAIPHAKSTVLAGQDHLVGAKALMPLLVESLNNERPT